MTAPGQGTTRRPLPVPAVLGLGLLGVAAVMLLLFGPFHGGRYEPPGRFLQWWLVNLSGGLADVTGLRAAQRLASRLVYDYLPLLILVLVLVMALLPAAVAFVRRPRDEGDEHGEAPLGVGSRGAGSRGAGPRGGGPRGGAARETARRRDRRSSLVFSDDGSIGEVGAEQGEVLERGIGELRVLSAGAGLPWHSRFETEGGARAFLEILRARGDGPATVSRAEDPAHGGEPSRRAARATADEPVRDAADTAAPRGGFETAEIPSPGDPERPALAADEDADRAAWMPGGVASVYTPTTLYSSVQDSDQATQAADESDEDELEEGR